MTEWVADGAADHRQIISAERSPKTVVLFFVFAACAIASLTFYDGVDPYVHPAKWFYTMLGMAVGGAGALATGWLIIRPQTNRIELDHDGLVLRSLFRKRRYLWRQIGPFGPVEQSFRARFFPSLSSWYAGAFNARTLRQLGEVRAPEDDELHAADVNLNPFVLERGPKLKTTRRFCDILNEWRSTSLADDPDAALETDSDRAPRPKAVRRRVYTRRFRLIMVALAIIVFVAAGPWLVSLMLANLVLFG